MLRSLCSIHLLGRTGNVGQSSYATYSIPIPMYHLPHTLYPFAIYHIPYTLYPKAIYHMGATRKEDPQFMETGIIYAVPLMSRHILYTHIPSITYHLACTMYSIPLMSEARSPVAADQHCFRLERLAASWPGDSYWPLVWACSMVQYSTVQYSKI